MKGRDIVDQMRDEVIKTARLGMQGADCAGSYGTEHPDSRVGASGKGLSRKRRTGGVNMWGLLMAGPWCLNVGPVKA